MANTFFKSFAESDRTSSRTLLHEAIPITGSLLSGTYLNNSNIKSFSHGMFKSVYDYPYLSSSANHLFDVSWGYSTGSCLHGVSCQGGSIFGTDPDIVANVTTQSDKKKNMYNQMAQILAGYTETSEIRLFDQDGNMGGGGSKYQTPVFISLSRLLVKDEIKKGSFSLTMGKHNTYTTPFDTTITLTDSDAERRHLINSPAGEYGLLYTSSVSDGSTEPLSRYGDPRGLIFYQAGIVVIPSTSAAAGGVASTAEWINETAKPHRDDIMKTGSMDQFVDGFIHRIQNISFNNTTELNSTIYFCRANHNEFNYSSNPTYLTGSKIRVKGNNVMAPPRSYATTVGLYSADNELLAVAKLSEPLRKDPTNELTLRVRLDY